MKILICEDDKAISGILEFSIKREMSVEIVKANDGKEAMEQIDMGHFDLILTDVHMPYHSGLEVVEYVRKDKKSKTPIIVLSVEGFEDTVLRALRLGADDYVVKPFNPIELSVRIRRHLTL